MPPTVSVVLAVFNGAETLGRAIRSVIAQSFTDWELIVVDDGSTDASTALARSFDDPRIRILQTSENSGVAATRNVAIQAADGELIAYLDRDDEFAPDYLGQARSAAARNELVISTYDIVHNAGTADERIKRWNPAAVRHRLFAHNITVPLGVMHRRDVLDRVGLFNETIAVEEDWDLWKRIARSGAECLFSSILAGRYHVRPDGQSRRPHVPAPIRRRILENHRFGRPLFHTEAAAAQGARVRSVAFASAHSFVDYGSGAAIATMRALSLLQHLGYTCSAFSGSHLDFPDEELVEELLAKRGISYEVRRATVRGYPARLLFADVDGIPITMFLNSSTRGRLAGIEEPEILCAAYDAFLAASRPDVVLTYGGDPITQTMIELTKLRDIPVVFGLHNLSYGSESAFALVDYVLVPSGFSAAWYWESLGLHCHVLPNVVEERAVLAVDRSSVYVTFVNPQATKGAWFFYKIASEVAGQRPDIPFLIVESRGQAMSSRLRGLDLEALPNVTIIPNTPRPAEFYGLTKLLLMPSLWNESFGLVAGEAMANGIPVLASNRGALPEIVGDGGVLLSIPERYTSSSREIPTAAEVAPWAETIIRLWDDPQEYAAACDRARRHAQRWHPDRLAPLYQEFFSNLAPQPLPPLAPPGVR